MTAERCHIAVVGSGFAGSLIARLLATLGYDVVLLERGTHPRFAIGESSTPLANLSLERLAMRYGFADCYRLATHGRWLEHYPEIRRGLKRGFTFYRHHPGESFANRGIDAERLLVAASPNDAIADTHWLRADVDHHFVREAIAAGVDYRDRTELTAAIPRDGGMRLSGHRSGMPLELDAQFVIDASGPGGFLARQLEIPSALDSTETRAALVFSHFTDVGSVCDAVPGLPEGPYVDDWAAVHHLIDEGWMYSLRFDDGVTSAGLLLTPDGLTTLGDGADADRLWKTLIARYPTIDDVFGKATPLFPLRFIPQIQHRLAQAAGDCWVMLPHAFAFVDPLFSTGIAWGLRAVERLGLLFEAHAATRAMPNAAEIARYGRILAREADQIDRMIAAAYEGMAHFDLFTAHAMIYFTTVSYSEVRQRVIQEADVAWRGFMGVDDPVLEPVAGESLARLRHITRRHGETGSRAERRDYAEWAASAVAQRNIAGLADPARHNLYPVDLDVLVNRHALLSVSREELMAAMPSLRGMAREPAVAGRGDADRSTSQRGRQATAPQAPAPR
jgi:FADH2 O2-dependent halogenase